MKTIRDFDITQYRNIVYEIGKEKGFSEDELEQVLAKLLEQAKNKLETKVHCLTCGIVFPLNNLQHECQDEDIWLFEYVKNSVQHKELNKRHISKKSIRYKEEIGWHFEALILRQKKNMMRL